MAETIMKWTPDVGVPLYWQIGMPVTLDGRQVGAVKSVEPFENGLYLTIDIDDDIKIGGVDGLSVHVRGADDND